MQAANETRSQERIMGMPSTEPGGWQSRIANASNQEAMLSRIRRRHNPPAAKWLEKAISGAREIAFVLAGILPKRRRGSRRKSYRPRGSNRLALCIALEVSCEDFRPREKPKN
jgi:hypothetical protein